MLFIWFTATISKYFWCSVFQILFVFNFNERFASFVVTLAHHFILVGTLGGDGASNGGVRDLATLCHILNDIGNDFWVKLVFRWFTRLNECYLDEKGGGMRQREGEKKRKHIK